jgi:hypothetical protein
VVVFQNSTDNSNNSEASYWFIALQKKVHSVLIVNRHVASGIKIAILDTGASFSTSQYKGFHGHRISGCRTWCDARMNSSGRSFMDAGGKIEEKDLAADSHGTHALSALRKVAPNCTIFVAQVFRDGNDIKNGLPSRDQAQRIADVSTYSDMGFACS